MMAQLGHAHPAFTLRVYTHLMRRGKEERARLKALVQGEGTGGDDDRVARGRGGGTMTSAIGRTSAFPFCRSAASADGKAD